MSSTKRVTELDLGVGLEITNNKVNVIPNIHTLILDTGWVEVTSAEIAKGAVYFRRIGNTCYCAIGGGDFDTMKLANNASHYAGNRKLVGIPKGFRLQRATLTNLTEDGQRNIAIVVLTSESDANIVAIRGMVPDASVGLLRMPIVSYPTEDPFPTEYLKKDGTI